MFLSVRTDKSKLILDDFFYKHMRDVGNIKLYISMGTDLPVSKVALETFSPLKNVCVQWRIGFQLLIRCFHDQQDSQHGRAIAKGLGEAEL